MAPSVTLGQPHLPADVAPAPPVTMFIFGAGGDLTKRLLMPALYNLAQEGCLDPAFEIVGVDHIDRTEDDYRTFLKLVAAEKLQTRPLISEIVSPEAANDVYARLAETKNPPLGIVFDWQKIR